MLYTIAYMMEGVYFSAANAFLVSMPIQIFLFFVWSKHKSGKTKSELVKMKWWQLLLAITSIFPAWAGCYFGISGLLGGTEPLLDSLVFVFGILISTLIAFRFIEGQYFNLVLCSIGLVMWIIIFLKSPSNINFLIIAAYNLFRTIQPTINWTMIYLKQKNEKKQLF